jgi:uncharacterized protein YuzE
MKVTYDASADAMYMRLSEQDILESEEVRPGIMFDFDKEGRLVGIEILDVKRNVAPGLTIAQAAE